MAFNGIKTREWKSGSTPADGTPALGSLFNEEFDRLYGNDNYLKVEVDKLGGASLDIASDLGGAGSSDAKIPSQKAVKTYADKTYPRGQLVGGLKEYDSSHPPYILPGSYEVHDGTLAHVDALLPSGTDGFIGDNSPRQNTWYYVLMNKSKSVKLQVADGGYIGKTYNITSITGGNTINFSGIAGGVQPVSGMIVVLEGITAEGERGFWFVNSVSGSPVTSIVIAGTLTNQGSAAGTAKIYYRMSTYHFGAGSEVGITVLADIEKYTPSPADALFSIPIVRDWAWYDPARNGYYSKWTGYTEYRILGCACTNASAQYIYVVPYKSGRNKNDNLMDANDINGGYVTTVTGPTFAFYGFNAASFKRLWGNDFILSDDSTNGFRVTALRLIKVCHTQTAMAQVDRTGGATAEFYIYVNGVGREKITISTNTTDWIAIEAILAYSGSLKETDYYDIRFGGTPYYKLLRRPSAIFDLM